MANSAHVTSAVLLICAASATVLIGQHAATPSVTWLVDNLATIGGHPVTVVGKPVVVDTPVGTAIEFNGSTDGLFVDVNPLAGMRQFTVEVMLSPAVGGAEEQRFLHLSQNGADNRALMELRLSPEPTWCLDTYLRFGPTGLALIDRTIRHPAGSWHTVGLTYDGKTMKSFVDGKQELTGEVAFGPIGAGRTSIGVRQNLVSWFRGRIRLVRFSPEALPASQLLTVPGQ